MTEHRSIQVTEIRAVADKPRMFEADVLTYGVLDSYRTIFDQGVFDESMNDRLPRITWGHDWKDPIGRYVDYKNVEQRDALPAKLSLIGELDDFDAVPRARQAHAQLKSGTIDQFSVGFSRTEGGTYEDDDGITHFRSASLDEVALVLVGAVPGTCLISVRSKGEKREVSEDLLFALARKVAAGEMTQTEADVALTLAAGAVDLGEAPPVVPADTSDPAIAQADEALAILGLG